MQLSAAMWNAEKQPPRTFGIFSYSMSAQHFSALPVHYLTARFLPCYCVLRTDTTDLASLRRATCGDAKIIAAVSPLSTP